MSQEKKKAWFKRHPFLTGAILLFVVLPMISGILQSNGNKSDNTWGQTQANQESIKKVVSYKDKNSGYTLEECNTACDDTYDIQLQVDVCQSTCAAVGKEGASLDKAVNSIKEIQRKKTNSTG